MYNYNKLNEYYKKKFGERTLKICVDGGFTCPNRDGKKGYGGCIFCGALGAGENTLKNKSVKEQVEYILNSKSRRANKFIVYFQNFTNTYDTVENLKKKYDSSLIDDRIVGLAIGTRPDCISEDIAKLLKSYKNKYYVCVELGLQTSNNETGKLINRCYTSEQFTKAVEILNKYNIDVVTHIMVGLPNETKDDIINTINFVNSHKLQGIKIHSTYIVENTVLANMYKTGEYQPLEFEDYMENLIYIITHINPNFIIHRISGDAPKDILLAPSWNIHKKWVLNEFHKRLKENDLWQGKFYKEIK